jgi:hypothetical protein
MRKALGSVLGALALALALGAAIAGDTFKDPSSRNGWADGTPQSSNLAASSDRHLYPNYLGP